MKTLEEKALLVVVFIVAAGLLFFGYDNWRYESAKSLKKAAQERKDLETKRERIAEKNVIKEQKSMDKEILRKAVDMCQTTFANNLKNKSSYRNESEPSAFFSGEVDRRSKISVILSYSATNSYGGRLDNTALCILGQKGVNKYQLFYVNGSKPAGFDEYGHIYTIGL